jgi:hypothetical protein
VAMSSLRAQADDAELEMARGVLIVEAFVQRRSGELFRFWAARLRA